EGEDKPACYPSTGSEPEGRHGEETRLRSLPVYEPAKGKDESERDHAEDGERENGHDGAREAEEPSREHEHPGTSIPIHGWHPLQASRCIRRRSSSNGFRSAGITMPGSSTFKGRPWSRFRFHTSPLKATIFSVASVRERGISSRSTGNTSAWTLP